MEAFRAFGNKGKQPRMGISVRHLPAPPIPRCALHQGRSPPPLPFGARDFWLGAQAILKIKSCSEKIKHIKNRIIIQKFRKI
jgi:hypothetical protein